MWSQKPGEELAINAKVNAGVNSQVRRISLLTAAGSPANHDAHTNGGCAVCLYQQSLGNGGVGEYTITVNEKGDATLF